MIAFHLPIIPPKSTSQGAGKRMAIIRGKPMFFKNTAAASAEHDLLVLCAAHKPAAPIGGPVRLQVDFVWPWRANEPKKRRALKRVPHTSKPDCSNIIKLLEDCLTKLEFWRDDGLVADLRVSKAWGDKVGIYVAITPLEESPAPTAAPVPASAPTAPPHVSSPNSPAQPLLF